MRAAMSAWPEIVFVNGTYSLVNLDLTLMVLLVEDGNGRSEVVGSALIDTEDAETLQWFVDCFQKDNLKAASKIKCFMTDKDMIERSVFEKTFPAVEMYLCLFHTLKTFRRVVTSRDMDLKEVEKNDILLMLLKVVYSDDEVDYMKKYQEFKNSRPIKIVDYYNKNWHLNRHQWLKHAMINGNFNNATNNRLESVNAKIKAIVHRRNPLSIFIDRYFRWYQSHTQENDLLMARQFLKEPVLTVKNEAAQYSAYLTPFAFEEVCKELNACNEITFRDCDLQTKTCIILVHFLNQCAYHVNTIFLGMLCAERWTKRYVRENQRFFNNRDVDDDAAEAWHNTTITVTPRKKPITVQDKRRKVSLLTNKIVNAISVYVELNTTKNCI